MYVFKLKFRQTIQHIRSIPGTGETERCGSHVEECTSLFVISENYSWYKEAAIAYLKAKNARDDSFEFLGEVSCEYAEAGALFK